MNAPVEFRIALSNSYPSGTGSYNYTGSFQIVVQNMAYEKHVSVWARKGATWQDIPAQYTQPLPGGLELWSAPASDSEEQFDVKYSVNGRTYWDNNGGKNYTFPRAYDEFEALTGIHYPIVLGSATMAPGNLHVSAAVQNLSYQKTVGIVYTTNNWITTRIAYLHYNRTMSSGLEVWTVDVPVGPAAAVEFALFYRVNSIEYWDNNFWRNYTVSPSLTPLVV
jgi:hypothetical protein